MSIVDILLFLYLTYLAIGGSGIRSKRSDRGFKDYFTDG